MRSVAKPRLLFGLALIVLALLLYWESFSFFFFNDDFQLLYMAKHRSAGDIVQGAYPEAQFPDYHSLYWRPGWHGLFKIVYLLAGLHPGFYMGVGMLLHVTVVLLIYLLLCRSGAAPWIGFLACFLFLSSPAYLEGVFWPSASFNVLPAALLHLLAVAALLRYAAHPAWTPYLACFACFALSLTFKETAYNFPILLPAALLILNPNPFRLSKLPRIGLLMLPFIAAVAIHYALLNRFNLGGYSIVETAATAFHWGAEYFRQILQLNLGDTMLWVALAATGVVLFVLLDRPSRFYLIWTAASLFPFAVRAYGPRFTYFCHIPLALLIGSGLFAVMKRKGRPAFAAMTASGVLAVAGIFNLLQVPLEMNKIRSQGDTCRNILEWCETENIQGEKAIYVDYHAPALANGFREMLELFLGAQIKIHNLVMLQVPPFLVYGNPDFDGLSPETVILQLRTPKPAAGGLFALPGYVKTTKEELEKENLTLPMFGFRYDYGVAAPQEALKSIERGEVNMRHTVLLDRKPTVEIDPGAAGTASMDHVHMISLQKMTLDVRCKLPCLLLLCLPIKLDMGMGEVRINGKKVKPMRANGVFNAVELREGQHYIEISTIMSL